MRANLNAKVILLAFAQSLSSSLLAADIVGFNRDIRPILSDKCFTCHGPDAANRKTKLRFDIESGAMIELREGRHAIVPGDSDKSEMVRRITSADKTVRMPPAYMGREKLSDHEIGADSNLDLTGRKMGTILVFCPAKAASAPSNQRSELAKQPDRLLHPKPFGT